jgi:two-component sensor histidine kinase
LAQVLLAAFWAEPTIRHKQRYNGCVTIAGCDRKSLSVPFFFRPPTGLCYETGMNGIAQRFMQILACQPVQPALVRWLGACALFVLALSARFWLGALHGANPALTFYPAIFVAAVLFGLKEAFLILALAVTVGSYVFLAPGMYLQPIGWLIVGGLNIAIIGGLKSLAAQLGAANERQRVLFQELQHRVANTLQSVVGTIELAKRRINSAPDVAAQLLDDTSQRLAASADVHRRLHDPALFHRGLESILKDAVATVVDGLTVNVTFDIEPFDLTFDQMSTLTMLVIETTNNAQKHVFRRGHGSGLLVSLHVLGSGIARLVVKDDGPGQSEVSDALRAETGLGLQIVEGLVKQIQGALRIDTKYGTQITVEFPMVRR